MADAARTERMSAEEFHRWHQRQEGKYELVEGVPVLKRGMGPKGMVGGSLRHALIGSNTEFALRTRLRGSDCTPFGSDVSIRTGPDQIRYPDAAVDCGTQDQTSRELAQPVLVLEVLSPSTTFIDQTQKLEEYKAVPTMRHILIVEQRRISAQLFTRTDGDWSNQRFDDPNATITLPTLSVEFPLSELYEGVTLDPE